MAAPGPAVVSRQAARALWVEALCLHALLLGAGAATGRVGEAVIGDVRVQALTPTLLRVEPKGPKGFEDRPTFMVANRSFPGLPITVQSTADGHVAHTEHYDVLLRGREGHGCGEALQDTDAEPSGTERSDGFPDGKLVPDSDACCAACASDSTCSFWVYSTDTAECYTLKKHGPLVKGASQRVFGYRPGGVGFQVRDPSGAVLYDTLEDENDARHLLRWPAPLSAGSFALVDHPRFHVPKWGATPVPPLEEAKLDKDVKKTNGYDFENFVEGDTYVFLLGNDLEGWMSSRAEFAALAGPVPQLPDYAYGTWFTWWHPYDEPEARSDIARWEEDSLPLDVWGLDMNWRHVSDDQDRFYDHPNTGLFPDFDGFLQHLREKGLRTFFNDHPFPVASRGAGGLQGSPEEVEFRWEGLTSWMARGVTFWWYDVNWGISIPPPGVNQSGTAGNWYGLGNAAWGSHVYFTIVERFRKMMGSAGTDDSRGIALSKFARDDARPGDGPKGSNRPPERPGQHRYPVWWTGDDVNLQASVESMVEAGLHDFKPFVHSDCGGDHRGEAGNLLRWTAHCAFGTILRFHGADHRPWTYDGSTEEVIKAYLRMRYKLLPTLIAAGHEATENGFPLAARGDLFWPEETGSTRNDQYIFLRDLLVAPITDSSESLTSRDVWIPPGEWEDVWSGEVISGPQEVQSAQPYERQPMFYRRDGGMFVISQEDVTRTADQKWKSLTLEVFPSSQQCTTIRALYERLSGARSNITLVSDGAQGVQLRIDQAEEAAGRSWVVRFHLRPGQAITSVKVDGHVTVTPAIVMEPLDSDPGVLDFFPFGGVDARPAPRAGPLAILQLRGGLRARNIEVVLSGGGGEEIVTALYSLRGFQVNTPAISVPFAAFIALGGFLCVMLNSMRRRVQADLDCSLLARRDHERSSALQLSPL